MSHSITFTENYRHVAKALYTWAQLRVPLGLRHLIEPEDLAQEVCLRAWGAYENFDPEVASFRAWVLGVARHAAQDLFRRASTGGQGANGGIQGTSAIGKIPDDVTAVSVRAAREEAVVTVLAQARELSDADRSLLLYRGIEGRAHKDIAVLIGIEPEAAKKRWQRLSRSLSLRLLPSDILHPDVAALLT